MTKTKLCMNCGEWLHESFEECRHCKGTELEIINSDIVLGDYLDICKISKDPNFIKAMIELHDTDPIEYQLKISQFKQHIEDNKPHCPHCKSTNISSIGTGERVGSIAVWGIFSKKINKSFKCNSCGYTW